MKIFIIIVSLLDFLAILLIAIEDIYFNKFEKLKYYALVLFIPMIGAIYMIYKLVRGEPSDDNGEDNGYNSIGLSTGFDSGIGD